MVLQTIFGIFTDAFPFLGTRRKSYIVTGAILSVASFIALIYTPHRYADLLAMCIANNLFMVITSTAVGGFMTEKAQSLEASGRFASVFQIAYQTAGVVGGPISGILAWDGEGIKRVRAGKGNSHVLPGRRLTLHLMIQPKIAQRFFSDTDFQDQGILSRILVSHPESLIGTRMQQEVDPNCYAALEYYENCLTEMLSVPFQYTAPNNKELAPRQLPLDNEAAKLWHEYSDKNETMMRLGERYENIRALRTAAKTVKRGSADICDLCSTVKANCCTSPPLDV